MFHVGDRVVGVSTKIDRAIAGVEGTVRFVKDDNIGVVWDRHVDGHSLSGTCKYGYGWRVLPQHIKLLPPLSLENK